jgi:hypothetical protein
VNTWPSCRYHKGYFPPRPGSRILVAAGLFLNLRKINWGLPAISQEENFAGQVKSQDFWHEYLLSLSNT